MRTLVIAILIGLGIQGCGRVSIDQVSLPQVTPTFFSLKLGEFISGTTRSQTTASGFVVQSATGSYSSAIKQVTPNGYTTYTTVQGAAVSK